MIVTNDCYGTFKIQWQGADLETREITVYAEAMKVLGAFAQDPAGWTQRYSRPNPNSTAGLYNIVLFSGGTQGSTWPYVPTVKLSIELLNESTQASALISIVAITIAITDSKAFLLSLRKVLGIKGKIDPALFVVGPTELKEEEEK